MAAAPQVGAPGTALQYDEDVVRLATMTRWWYRRNAVGFFLTAGFLGIMYYFIPTLGIHQQHTPGRWPLRPPL
jgi:hypothetical protein